MNIGKPRRIYEAPAVPKEQPEEQPAPKERPKPEKVPV